MLRRRVESVDLAHQGRHGVGGETELSELTELGTPYEEWLCLKAPYPLLNSMMCASQAVAWTTSLPEGPAT